MLLRIVVQGLSTSTFRFRLLTLQTVSVTVSVLTLTFISIDRWYAICFPLRYVSTNERAIGSIAFIWLVALLSGKYNVTTSSSLLQPNTSRNINYVILTTRYPLLNINPLVLCRTDFLTDIPEFLALTTTPKDLRYGITLFTQCQTKWDKETEKHFYITRLVTLYM